MCIAKELCSVLHSSAKLRDALGDLAVDDCCDILRKLNSTDVTYSELLCFAVNPKGEGSRWGTKHVDPLQSVDFSSLRMRQIVEG